MSSPKLREETQRWLQFARQDIADAEALLQKSSHFRNVCFLAQQCAEKALKAILVWNGLEVPFRHDLEHLRGLIPPGWNIPETNWPALTAWATHRALSRRAAGAGCSARTRTRWPGAGGAGG
ncbi:MAG TPA: HEPN domain-containing protein, partial [Candidatus Dormibacteraeota bacterium]